jgi:ADP-ribose pyrophosphatase
MKIEVISSETIYQGRVFDVRKDTIREGGNEYSREIINHHGSVVIVPVFDDQRVALVKQYRHPAKDYLFEIPAGTMNKDETPEVGARRELEEEIGVVCDKIEKLTEFYVSPGFLAEKMFVYLATELSETKQNLDEDEFIQIHKFTFDQAFKMIRENAIKDAKTMVGLILAGAKLGFFYK